jgi:hypothetical protein
VNTRSQIEISEDMNSLNAQLVRLRSRGAPGWETDLRIMETELRLREVTEELVRLGAGLEYPGK